MGGIFSPIFEEGGRNMLYIPGKKKKTKF